MDDQKVTVAAELNRQIALTKSYQEDLVDGIYKLNINSLIYELSNEFCKYYDATSIEDDREYFAIIFEKNFIPDIHALQILKLSNFTNLNKLITYSVVQISSTKSYHLVVIVEKYNFTHTLDSYIIQNGPLPVEQIETFIVGFNTLLEQLERMRISCGNINPSNIIVLDNGDFLLRETIISYPNFYQEFCYLAPEIAECTESGRLTAGVATDIYALGMTVFYALTGKKPWLEYENAYIFNEERFEHTTFKLLLSKRKFLEHIKLFFRWTLHDSAILRWQTRNITEWLADKIDKSSVFEKITENTNLIAFNGHNYGNLKSIAYAFFYNWDEALHFIQDDRLLKWVQRNNVSANVIEELQELLSADTNHTARLIYGNERNWKLTRLLTILDPCGGIRQEGIAVSPLAIPTALHYLNSKNRKISVDCITKAIKDEYWQLNNKLFPCELSTDLEQTLRDAAKFFSFSSAMFGLERVIYSLNPNAICFSSVLVNQYVWTLRELLITLDATAMTHNDKFSIDRHVIAFIAAKISLTQESDIKILHNFPKFSEHYLIHALSVLSIAQQYEPDVNIQNLCNAMVIKVVELLNENLYSQTYVKHV